jgi:hypothetical protein
LIYGFCEYKLYYYNLDESVLATYNYDILWEIDDEKTTVKANLTWAEIKTDGRLKSSELTANGTTAGFNVSSIFALRSMLMPILKNMK